MRVTDGVVKTPNNSCPQNPYLHLHGCVTVASSVWKLLLGVIAWWIGLPTVSYKIVATSYSLSSSFPSKQKNISIYCLGGWLVTCSNSQGLLMTLYLGITFCVAWVNIWDSMDKTTVKAITLLAVLPFQFSYLCFLPKF